MRQATPAEQWGVALKCPAPRLERHLGVGAGDLAAVQIPEIRLGTGRTTTGASRWRPAACCLSSPGSGTVSARAASGGGGQDGSGAWARRLVADGLRLPGQVRERPVNGTVLVRPPSSRLAEGIVTHISRTP